MRPLTSAGKLLLQNKLPNASVRPFRTSCHPPSISIGIARYRTFSSTAQVANFREQRKQEFERLAQVQAEKNEQKDERRSRRFDYLYAAIMIPLALLFLSREYRLEGGVFISDRFMRFTITRREYVSSTAFILTVRPKQGPTNRATVNPYPNEWEKGGWTVRLAQPEMQIARAYTPLPPLDSDKLDELRFLVRKVNGGEVSTYLSRLPVGAEVSVQYWHPSVDTNNLKDTTDILFLAGGTGIAPAMQLAHALFERQKREDGGPKMHIVWANQKREDCLGGSQDTIGINEGRQNRIVAELEALRRKHPDRLSIEYVVDEERTFIDEKKIQQNMSTSPASTPMSKVILVCGSEGFVRYLAGSTLDDDARNGQNGDMMPAKIVGGLLGRINSTGWEIIKMP